jgi:hypothetical protein
VKKFLIMRALAWPALALNAPPSATAAHADPGFGTSPICAFEQASTVCPDPLPNGAQDHCGIGLRSASGQSAWALMVVGLYHQFVRTDVPGARRPGPDKGGSHPRRNALARVSAVSDRTRFCGATPLGLSRC